MNQNDLKKQAAAKALRMVQNGMYIGLGTGSTASIFIELLAKRVEEEKLDILCVATSKASYDLAQKHGLSLATDLDPQRMLDITVDGADEIAPNLSLTKGLGGALLMEKIVALHTKYQIIIGDETKLVQHLGEKCPIPVEVIPFSWQTTASHLEKLALKPKLRDTENGPYVTDMGHFILDCSVKAVLDDKSLDAQIKAITGVVDHGLFIGIAKKAIIATQDGILEKE